MATLGRLEACKQFTRYDELLFDENLLMLDLPSRLPSRQASDQIVEVLRYFPELSKARQQTCEASAKRISKPDDVIGSLRLSEPPPTTLIGAAFNFVRKTQQLGHLALRLE
jgi:hypothetical protein